MKYSFFFYFFLLCCFTFDLHGQTEENNDYQYVLIEAAKQKNLGNFNEAVNLYKLVIKSKSDCDIAFYELGNLYQALDKPESAKEALKSAYVLAPSNFYYLFAYSEILSVSKDYKTALKILKKGIKDFPEKIELKLQYADVLANDGKIQASVKILKKIEVEKGFSDKVTLLLADIYSRNEHYSAALEQLDKLISWYPEISHFYIMAAELSEKAGLKEKSLSYYSEAFNIDSLNIYAVSNLADYYREKNETAKSLFFLKYSFYDKAIDLKRKLTILSYYLMNDTIASSYQNQIGELFKVLKFSYPEEDDITLMEVDYQIGLNHYSKAYALLKPLLFSSIRNYNLWLQGIQLSFNSGDAQDAVLTCSKALELFPDSTLINYFYSVSLFQVKDYKAVLCVVDDIDMNSLTDNGMLLQVLSIKAESLNGLKRFNESDTVFESILLLDPYNSISLNNYAYYLSERGEKLEKALSYSEKAVGLEPGNSTYMDTYAWVLFKMNRFEDAWIYIERALDLGGNNDSDVLLHAGFIAESLKQKDKALILFRKSLEMGGDEDIIVKEIEKLISNTDE